MINQFFVVNSFKEEILKIKNGNYTNEFKKEKIGSYLLKISKNYGTVNANKIIEELNLTKFGISYSCPLLRAIKKDKQ